MISSLLKNIDKEDWNEVFELSDELLSLLNNIQEYYYAFMEKPETGFSTIQKEALVGLLDSIQELYDQQEKDVSDLGKDINEIKNHAKLLKESLNSKR